MRKVLIIILLFSQYKIISQNVDFAHKIHSKEYNFIDNKSLKYSCGLVSCDTCVPISNIGYRVIIKLTEREEYLVKDLKIEEWLKLLDNPKKDWAANIILYWIFDKDFLALSRTKRSLWRKYLKKEDIEFWKKSFTEKNK